MGMLYEAFATNPHTGHAKDTSRRYLRGNEEPANLSLKVRPLIDPGGSGRLVDSSFANSNNNAGVCDEETSVEPKEIVLSEIEQLIDTADGEGQTHTVFVLGELKEFIEKL